MLVATKRRYYEQLKLPGLFLQPFSKVCIFLTVRWTHLIQQMSSHRGSHKLIQGQVFHSLATCNSNYCIFFKPMKWL